MATTPADQQRSILLAATLLTAALTIVAVRALKAGRLTGARPVPTAEVQSLTPFLGPLRDSTGLAHAAHSPQVIARDPFGLTVVAHSTTSARATTVDAARPSPVVAGHWIVSTILVEGSKKSAIVNDAWVTIGDPLGGGSRLTAVERDHIVVTDANGVRHKVPIQGGEPW